jgi:hypothetical protein
VGKSLIISTQLLRAVDIASKSPTVLNLTDFGSATVAVPGPRVGSATVAALGPRVERATAAALGPRVGTATVAVLDPRVLLPPFAPALDREAAHASVAGRMSWSASSGQSWRRRKKRLCIKNS